jgi:signal transduction histidine kinase
VESDSLSAQTKNNIDMAYQESEKILSLVNDVLDIEKIESELAQSAPIWIYLKECIELAIKECNPDAQKYNVSFTIKEPIVKISIFVDVLRLVQVMTNLLSNASKYSPPHSNIIITTVDQDDFVRVSITDRGPGISEKDRAHLFEKFPQAYNTEQNEKSGTGLGLHICKTIIEQLGGNIGFEPGALQGTTFYFDLPKTLADPRIESSAGFSAT